jgi:hypothetical protein
MSSFGVGWLVSKVDVYAMGVYLGLVPEREGRLMWIAKQATMAPVPSGWTEHEDASGLYYHNTDSEETR